jgi:hypothetical protein
MSPKVRWVGYYGNGALAVFAGFMALYSLGQYGLFLGSAAVCALAIFNMRIVRWAAQFTSEEEWLKAEVRKAELRKELASFGKFAAEEDALPAAAAEATVSGASGTLQPPTLTPDSGDGK